MTMSIEDKFNKNIAWMLDELQADMLVSSTNTVNFHFITEEAAPSRREQERVLSWLYKLGAIQHLRDLHSDDPFSRMLVMHPFTKAPTIGEKVQVDMQVFTPLREIFSGEWEKETASTVLKKAEKLRRAQKIDTTPLTKPTITKIPIWSKETTTIVFLGKSCDVPAGNQRVLCDALFAVPLNSWVDEEDVVRNFNRDGKQSFYDAQRLLNERIQKALGIKDLIEYQQSKARINPETIKKLNQSET
jgi:hypothetical protein